MIAQTQTGASYSQQGSFANLRGGKQGDGIFSELHGRFYEQNYNGNVFTSGLGSTSGSTAITNATYTVADGFSATLATAATATPILGIWNPTSSNVNAVILQASLTAYLTALQTTGGGGLVWGVSTNNAVISTGNTPFNRKTLSQTGSQCKGMCGVALTGLSNVFAFLTGSILTAGGNLAASTLQTAVGLMPAATGVIENFDGNLIVPPGAVLALFATTTPVAVNATGSLLWEEVPV